MHLIMAVKWNVLFFRVFFPQRHRPQGPVKTTGGNPVHSGASGAKYSNNAVFCDACVISPPLYAPLCSSSTPTLNMWRRPHGRTRSPPPHPPIAPAAPAYTHLVSISVFLITSYFVFLQYFGIFERIFCFHEEVQTTTVQVILTKQRLEMWRKKWIPLSVAVALLPDPQRSWNTRRGKNRTRISEMRRKKCFRITFAHLLCSHP